MLAPLELKDPKEIWVLLDLQVQVVFLEQQDQKETLGPKDHQDKLGHQGHLEFLEILDQQEQQDHLVI